MSFDEFLIKFQGKGRLTAADRQQIRGHIKHLSKPTNDPARQSSRSVEAFVCSELEHMLSHEPPQHLPPFKEPQDLSDV